MTLDHGARPLILGVPGSRRVEGFQEALAEVALPPARVMSWLEFIEGYSPSMFIEHGSIFRVESPGEDFETWRALVAYGRGRLSRREAFSMDEDPGRIRCGAQWYSGLCYAMLRLKEQLRAAAPHVRMNDPDEIALMFHKAACQQHLAAAGVPVPPALPAPAGWEPLVEQLRETPRVFLKPLHGSSASGVLALERGPRGQYQAWTSVEVADGRLYNNLKVRQVRAPGELALIVDTLCADGVHLERWVPKGSLGGKTVDLRVLCIAGQPRHMVVRASRTPLTNLHLGNSRGSVDALKRAVGSRGWGKLLAMCRQAAAALPGSLYVGLDVLLTPGWHKMMVLEANAFGDLLPGVRHRGEEAYVAELMALEE